MFTVISMGIPNTADVTTWKKALLSGVALLFTTLAASGNDGFQPEFSQQRIGPPDWLSVSTHLPGVMSIKTAPVTGQPFAHAATVELLAKTSTNVLGKATYFRSRPISAGSDRFAVEWYENIPDDLSGPQFELWGVVGKETNKLSRLLIRLVHKAGDLALKESSISIPLQPGWRHFKVAVSAGQKTFDLYYEDMSRAAAVGLPLLENIETTDQLGIGFCWYLSPNTPPTQWQIGGISLQPLDPSSPGKRAWNLWRPALPQGRLVVLENETPSNTKTLYDMLASNQELGQRFALDIVPYKITAISPSDRRSSSKARPPTETAVERAAPDIARDLGLSSEKLPAVILTTPTGEARRIWTGPLDESVAEKILATLKAKESTPSDAQAFPPPNTIGGSSFSISPSGEALKSPQNAPARWLILGTWAGPAGLSLWGLDYESKIHPNPGEPQIVTYWDSSWHARWEEQSSSTDGGGIIEKLTKDFIWSKGSAYAHLYIYSPTKTEVSLDFKQTGSEIYGWLNGGPLIWESLAAREKTEREETGLNDQGGSVVVRRSQGGSAYTTRLPLDAGWNRLLVKLIMRQRKGETFTFSARFSAQNSDVLSALRTSTADPSPTTIARHGASRFIPRVYTNAPFNLAYTGEPLTLNVDIGSADFIGGAVEPFVPQPSGRLELTVTDYDGHEVLRRTLPFSLPGRTTFDLGPAPARGYYATHLRLFDGAGNLVHAYPPDGFSVIGGASTQRERKTKKKMAVTYYFMARDNSYSSVYFPYMERIGILQNIGGHNMRAPDFYREAYERGLDVIIDTWMHRDPDYIRAYVEESSAYTNTYKAFNEVDIHPDVRGAPASWVAKEKQDYEIIKKANPSALILGASLVRPASDAWFGECLKLGLANYHDVWDVHCYPQTPPILEGTMSNSPNESELGVLKVYEKLGLKNTKPFWIGETAARSGHGNDARRWQADTTAKMVACALSRSDFHKIGFLVPWRYSRGESRYYIMDIEAGHMPVEAAYYTASALIDGFDYERLRVGKAVQAARFGPTLMAWTTDEQSQKVTLKPPGREPFVQVDVVGRVKDLPMDKDGTVTLSVGASPVYVVSRETYERLTR